MKTPEIDKLLQVKESSQLGKFLEWLSICGYFFVEPITKNSVNKLRYDALEDLGDQKEVFVVLQGEAYEDFEYHVRDEWGVYATECMSLIHEKEEKGYHIAKKYEVILGTPVNIGTINEVIAEHFKIDLTKCEEEKLQIIQALKTTREINNEQQ